MIDHLQALLALRQCADPALPPDRGWENVEFTPPTNTAYVLDGFVPATHRVLTATADQGTVEETGFYVVQWIGLADTGGDVSTEVTGLLAAFPPGLTLPTGDGNRLRIRTDVGPTRSQITNPPAYPGRAVTTVRIPWVAYTTNPSLTS